MTTTEQVQTLGPADPNAPLAAKFYAILSAVLGIAGAAATFGLITTEQAASLGAVGTATTTMIGAVGTAVAAFRTRKQVKNGTFTKAPDPIVVTAAPPISLDDVAQVRDGLTSVITDAVASAQGGLEQLAGIIPGGAAIVAGVPSIDDLIQVVRNRDAIG